MNVKTIYECSWCGKQHETEQECLQCEDMHVVPKQVIDAKYTKSPNSILSAKYPMNIEVLFNDGTIQTFYALGK